MRGPNVDMFIVIISSPRGARRWSAYKIIQTQPQIHHPYLPNQLYRDALTARYYSVSPLRIFIVGR